MARTLVKQTILRRKNVPSPLQTMPPMSLMLPPSMPSSMLIKYCTVYYQALAYLWIMCCWYFWFEKSKRIVQKKATCEKISNQLCSCWLLFAPFIIKYKMTRCCPNSFISYIVIEQKCLFPIFLICMTQQAIPGSTSLLPHNIWSWHQLSTYSLSCLGPRPTETGWG